MADRKEYLKEYVRKKKNKKKHAETVKAIYATPEGKAYDLRKQRYPRARFNRAKWIAINRRKKTWTLEFEDYLKFIAMPCTYCNRSMAEEIGSGLDRKDNTKGYELDNVNPSCGDCNRRRGTRMSADEFKRQTELNDRKLKWKKTGKK